MRAEKGLEQFGSVEELSDSSVDSVLELQMRRKKCGTRPSSNASRIANKVKSKEAESEQKKMVEAVQKQLNDARGARSKANFQLKPDLKVPFTL